MDEVAERRGTLKRKGKVPEMVVACCGRTGSGLLGGTPTGSLKDTGRESHYHDNLKSRGFNSRPRHCMKLLYRLLV